MAFNAFQSPCGEMGLKGYYCPDCFFRRDDRVFQSPCGEMGLKVQGDEGR